MELQTVNLSDDSVYIPSYYTPMEESDVPELCEGGITYCFETKCASCVVSVLDNREIDSTCYDQSALREYFHEEDALDANQGLIEITVGKTGGRYYSCIIIKTLFDDDVDGEFVSYHMSLDLKKGSGSTRVLGWFNEIGNDDARVNVVFDYLSKELGGDDAAEKAWCRDPYDPKWTQGFLMIEAEKPEYDLVFPDHPLSLAREVVGCILNGCESDARNHSLVVGDDHDALIDADQEDLGGRGTVDQQKGFARFISAIICNLEWYPFLRMKSLLVKEYLPFSIMQDVDVLPEILAERVCSYFATLEIKTCKPFARHLRAYLDALDSIVAPRIAVGPAAGKSASEYGGLRAKRYYEKAKSIRELTYHSTSQILDYSRIMFCLYAEMVDKGFVHIENFDYSPDCLDPQKIIRAMKAEEIPGFLLQPSKPRFDTRELYGTDTCTMILAIIILYAIVGESLEGEANE